MAIATAAVTRSISRQRRSLVMIKLSSDNNPEWFVGMVVSVMLYYNITGNWQLEWWVFLLEPFAMA
jgi:hypothetical protein